MPVDGVGHPVEASKQLASMLPSNLKTRLNAFHKQHEASLIAERERHDLVENMLHEIKSLIDEGEEKDRALRAKEKLAETYQNLFEKKENEVDNMRKSIGREGFVLVLIDGDDTKFKDEFVRIGYAGGENAARRLHEALFKYLEDKDYFKHDYKIVTKIYLNVMGISKLYDQVKVTTGSAMFQQFIQGFNKTHELMEIIDAGNGKEAADTKLKGKVVKTSILMSKRPSLTTSTAEFNLFYHNLHCKQIMFAGSGDNVYGGFLAKHVPNSGKSEKITLIEALPFARELKLIADKFEFIRFDDILRNSKIDMGQVLFDIESKHVEVPIHSSTPAKADTVTNSTTVTYAERVFAANHSGSATGGTSDTNAAVTREDKTHKFNNPSRRVCVNQFNQRVDTPIENIDKEVVSKLKFDKMCNNYFLGKGCNYSYCPFKHQPRLNSKQLENLRYVARLKACEKGLSCRDRDCINGHNCESGVKCSKWGLKQCRFKDEMHQVDLSTIKDITAQC